MGIRGMETFLEKNGTTAFPVSIKAEIEKAKRNGESTTIVVDALSCLRHVYGDLPWTTGGQANEFVENMQDFATKFTSLGAELVFFFDGPPAEVKLDIWRKRRLETMEKVNNFLDRVDGGAPASSFEGNDLQVFPPNNNTLSAVILKGMGCKVFRSIGECDEEIARYAHQNKCLAIFGQDSDFVVYPGNQHYWSAKHFDQNSMTTLEYSGRNLASSLGLRREQLPLLATLLGNDIVRREDLRSFHDGIVDSYHFSFYKTIQAVAHFVKTYPYGDELTPRLRPLAQRVFYNESKWTLLRDSVQSYNIAQPPKDDLEGRTGNEEWDAVLRLVRDWHVSGMTNKDQYGAVVRGIYTCTTSLEDYRRADLPHSQVILKKLRQKNYGILLFDKPKVGKEPHAVRELAMSGPRSIDGYVSNPVIAPRVSHPGLVDLWNNEENAFEDAQWSLMCDAVNIDHNVVRDSGVPLRLVVFLLALKYLMDEGLKLKMFELHALVSSAVILVDYTTAKLKGLPIDPLTTRAIRLYTLVARTYDAVILLNSSCGNPIPVKDAVSNNYQDGKLYHQAYRMAKRGSKISQLCENQENHIEVFNAILTMLPLDKVVTSV